MGWLDRGSPSVHVGHDIRVDGDHNEIYITDAPRPFDIVGFDTSLPEGPILTNPAALLTATYQVVPFVGRDDERTAFESWRDAEQRCSVHLLHGPGGHGKTRFGIEFARTSAAAGWTIDAASPRSHSLHKSQQAALATDRRLVIVDYAERWPNDTLLEMLTELSTSNIGRLRVLMIARHPGMWWAMVRNHCRRLDATCHEREIGSVLDATREELFVQAKDSFARALEVDEEAVSMTFDLDDQEFSRLLSIHMAALVAVETARAGDTTTSDPAMLTEYLIDREKAYWLDLHAHDPVVGHSSVSVQDIGRAAFVATLTGSLDAETARRVLQIADIASGDHARWLIDAHSVCFPAQSDDQLVLQPILPDRLGEDFVARSLVPGMHHDRQADGIVHRLLDGSNANESWFENVVANLAHVARWDLVREQWLEPTLQEHPEFAICSGVTLAAVAPIVSMETIGAIKVAMPRNGNPALASAAVLLESRLLEHLNSQAEYYSELAENHYNFGTALLDAGLEQESREHLEYSAGIYRWLREDRGAHDEVFVDELCRVLVNLSVAESDMGGRDRACELEEEALDLYRRHPPTYPAAERSFANLLLNHAGSFSTSGLHDEALRETEQAVEILERLSGDDGSDFQLLMARMTHAVRLANVERVEEALRLAHESIGAIREHAASGDLALLPGLSSSIENLGSVLNRAEGRAASIEVHEEAVAVARQLFELHPRGFGRQLAVRLFRLGVTYVLVERFDSAASHLEQSLALHEQLLAEGSSRAAYDVVSTLGAQGMVFRRGSRFDESARALDRASLLAETLPTEAEREDMQTGIGREYGYLGVCLREEEQYEKALSVEQKAIDLYSSLPESAERFERLADAFAQMTLSLRKLGRSQAVIAALLESIGHFRTALEFEDRLEFRQRLAQEIAYLGRRLSEEQRPGMAFVFAAEACDRYAELHQESPDEYEMEVAASVEHIVALLRWLAGELSSWGKTLDASTLQDEIRLMEESGATFAPYQFNYPLPVALRRLRHFLCAQGRMEDASFVTSAHDRLVERALFGTRGREAQSHDFFARFTDRARRVLVLANGEARGLGCGAIEARHLFLATLAEGEGLGAQALRSCGVELDGMRLLLGATSSGQLPSSSEETLGFDLPSMYDTLAEVEKEAAAFDDLTINAEVILLAVLGHESVDTALKTAGVSSDAIRQQVVRLRYQLAATARR